MSRQLTPSADLPTLVEGDDYTFAVSFTDRSGDPIDITDWTVSMTIADQQTSGGTPIVERDITTHDNATGGKTSWDLPGSETAGTTGTKRYDIQVVKSDGTTRTVALGTVGLLDGATDRAISGSGGSGVGASAGASINVTLDGDDSISLSIQGLTNYTDSDAVAAVDGSSLQSLSLGELFGRFDRLISSTSELESLSTDIQSDETVIIAQPDTPYRTSQWIDIDVSNATIIAESRYAKNGEALIKPADGADVGGLRVGFNSAVSDVDVQRIGFDGNESTMTDTVKRLHGITYHNVTRGEIRGCYATRTHPYHEHNSGGSGITVRHNCENIDIVGNYINDIGDRCIQMAGRGNRAIRNTLTNGFDRGVSINVEEPDGVFYASDQSGVYFNYIRDLVEGSCIGNNDVSVRSATIVGNIGEGMFRGLVHCNKVLSGTVVGNVCNHTSGVNGAQPGIFPPADGIVGLNVLYDPDGAFNPAIIRCKGVGEGAVVTSNVLIGGGADKTGIQSDSGSGHILGNFIFDVDVGVEITGRVQNRVSNNYIKDWAAHGIVNQSTGSDNLIEGNYLYAEETAPETGIRNNSEDATIKDNFVVDNGNIGTMYDMATAPRVIQDNEPVVFLSSTPANQEGNEYYDDGTNTASGTVGKRVYLGGSWMDAYTA